MSQDKSTAGGFTPFVRFTALACPLPIANIDTDQLIPARYMQRSRADGYGDYLLYDLRFDADGRQRPGFHLDAASRKGAQTIVTLRNFGAGSSREAAVYALCDFGIRCVVAPSFGDIFAANAVNNGLLPALITEEAANRLIGLLEGGLANLTVDLEAQSVTAEGQLTVPFEIEPAWRLKLMNGWDDLALTKSYSDAISAWGRSDALHRPWVQPRRDQCPRDF